MVERMRQSLIFYQSAVARLLARYRLCERASTAIEFACVAPMIVAILLAALQVSVIYIAQSYMETISESAMRIVLTNNAYSLTQAQFQAQLCANVTALFNCNNLIVQLEPVNCTSGMTTSQCVTSLTPQFTAQGNLQNPTTFNPGAPSTKMILIVMYQWPVISGPLGMTFSNVGNGTFLLASTEVFYIEPCTNANGCVPNG
jgi:Flp pilus assembly protein TadG